MSDLVKRLRIKAGMIEMGEMIAWGSDSALMREAADALEMAAPAMTTNNPPIAAWAPSTALSKLASRRNNSPCVLTDGPAEFNDVALIRLSDYEILQAECEKLRKHLQNLIDQTTPLEPVPGNPMWSRRIQLDEVIAERDQLRAECEKLRKDAARLDWLADPNNNIRIVQLPTAIVRQNLFSLRDAIDAAMEPPK